MEPNEDIATADDRLTKSHALFSELIQKLLQGSMERVDETITDVLGQMGRFCEVDRAYVFRLSETERLHNTHEWVADGVVPMLDALQDLPIDIIGAWHADFSAGRPIHIPSVEDLPDTRPERAILMMQGILSLVVVPITVDNTLIGFAGFDAVSKKRVFPCSEVYLLKALANIIGSVIVRRNAEMAIAATQLSIKLSADRKDAILKAMPELLLEIDADGMFLNAHAIHPEKYFLDSTLLVGCTIEQVFPTETAESFRGILAQIKEHGAISDFTHPISTPDGVRWYEISGSVCPAQCPQDRPGYLLVIRDVTQRVAAQAKLAQLGKIVEIMTNLVIVVDDVGAILWANPAFENQTGYALDEITGKRLSELVHGHASNTDVDAVVLESIAAGIAYSGQNVNYDRFGTPYYIDFNVHPLPGLDGTSRGFVSVETVTTPQRMLAKSLQGERDFLKALMETSVSAVVAFGPKSDIVFANAAAGAVLGCAPGDLDSMGRVIGAARLEHSRTGASGCAETPIDVVQRTNGPVRDMRCAVTGADGIWRMLSVNAAPVSGVDHEAQIVCAFTDITEFVTVQEALGRSIEHERYQADHDDATGLPNRRYFNRDLLNRIHQAKTTGETLAVFTIDLDNFKSINDGFGNAVGDQALQSVAKRLKTASPIGKSMSRVGGDEFMCILPAANADSAAALSTSLRNALMPPMLVSGMRLYTTASIGISFFPEDGHNVEALVTQADQAMYAAKAKGRNRHEFFTREQGSKVARRSEILQALRYSLYEDHFRLVYQPKFSLGPLQEMVGAEALLRWTSPTLGDISPAEFIPVAEASAMIVDIDFRVMIMFAAQLGAWVSQGYHLAASLNLSAQTFENPELANRLIGLLQYHRITPSNVTVEITESSLVSMTEMAMENISRIHDEGIGLSVDDFGTGHSSFTYLQRLTVNEVKIDRSFVLGIGQGEKQSGSEAIIRAIIAMAHAMDIKSVAEGVETLAQMTWLRAEGCDHVQGFKSGRPQDPATFEAQYLSGKVPTVYTRKRGK